MTVRGDAGEQGPAVLLTGAAEELYEALAGAQQSVQLVSPFLSMAVAIQLASKAEASPARWSLLTRLDPSAVAGGFLSTGGIRRLIEAGVEVRTAPRLHAKVYLVDHTFGLVGSANLTGSGLGSTLTPNLELSVRLQADAVVEATRQVATWWNDAKPVLGHDLTELEAEARKLPRAALVSLPELVGNGSNSALVDLLADARLVNLWVKAQYGEPDADQWREEFWFSSRGDRVPSFKAGDLVLIYARDVHACYAIVEVVDSPHNDPQFVLTHGRPISEAERWPWVNRTVPRLVPTDGRMVSPQDLGFTGQSLQGGHKRLDLAEFAAAARALAGDAEAL